jgi:succinoglycan biosynthesis protein ExoM
MATVPDIDICLCTFQRAHVVETLRSLARLTLKPDRTIRIIVADNDDTPSAKERVEATARDCSLPLTYLHAPARNISVARNACLNAAIAPLVAFIDDDEIASAAWLEALVTVLDRDNCDAVLGPVQALFTQDCPAWARTGDFHSTRPVRIDGKIMTGYAGNVLFRRYTPALKDRRFHFELGRSGGEDTVFFSEVYRAGGRIGYAPDAIVTETITTDRSRLSWLLKRRFRSGQIHGTLLSEDTKASFWARGKEIGLAFSKLVACFLAMLATFPWRNRCLSWMLRGSLHAGVVFRLSGVREIELYGQERNT